MTSWQSNKKLCDGKTPQDFQLWGPNATKSVEETLEPSFSWGCSWRCVGSLEKGSHLIFLSAWLPPTQQVAGYVWHNYIQTWRVFLFFQNLPKSASSGHFLRKRGELQKILCCRSSLLSSLQITCTRTKPASYKTDNILKGGGGWGSK